MKFICGIKAKNYTDEPQLVRILKGKNVLLQFPVTPAYNTTGVIEEVVNGVIRYQPSRFSEVVRAPGRYQWHSPTWLSDFVLMDGEKFGIETAAGVEVELLER